MEASIQSCYKRLAVLNESIDDEMASNLLGSFLSLEKEEVEEAKLQLMDLEEEIRGLVEDSRQRGQAWARLENELSSLDAVNAEHASR